MSSPDVIRYPGFQPYEAAWAEQRRLHAARVNEEIPDTVMLLEHEPVYTAGKRTSRSERPPAAAGAPVIDVDRGGKITWHGPGQIVGYPIVRLPEPVDVVAFVRRVEQVLIDVAPSSGSTPAESRCPAAAGSGCRPTTGNRTGRWPPSAFGWPTA